MTSQTIKDFDNAMNLGATNKGAVSKLVKAWEAKNDQRVKRAAGLGLMAVSLAACGGADDTPYSQDDVDALDDEIASLTTERDELQDAIDEATTAIEAAGADDLDSLIAERDQLVEDLETAEEEIAALELARTELLADLAPFTSATFTVANDLIITLDGDNALTATNLTMGAGDVVIDVSGDDSDSLTIAATGNVTAGVIQGYENITINNTAFTTLTHDLEGIADGTVTINNVQVGGATAATVSNAGDIAVVAGSGVTGTLTVGVSAAAATEVDGGSAATVTVSGITLGGVSVVTGASTTAINVDGSAATTDTVSISASGAVALATAPTAQVEALTLSGNGAAAVFTLAATNAPETVAFTGSQNVTLVGAAADFTTETFSNTSTGVATLRINNDATSDLSNVATSIIIDVADGTTGGATYTLANNANVLLTNAAVQTFDSTALVTGDETINLTVQIDGTGAAVTVSDFEIVNVATATPTTLTGSMDLELVAGATSVVTLTGSVALALDTASVANTLNAAAYTGAITMTTTAANIDNLTFGTGDDRITVTTGETITIDGGAGTDTLVAAADMDTTTFSNFEILDATTSVTNMDSSQLATALTIINGDVTVDNANTAVIDLSIHTVDTGVNFTVTGTLDTSVFATTQGLTITGNVNADSLTGTANADVISGGDGADTITGGAGADVIDLTETTSAADDVVIGTTDGSAVGTVGGTFSGFDVITGFATTVDDVDVTIVNGGGDVDTNIYVVAQTGATTAANDLADAAFANVDAVVAFLNDGGATLEASETSVVAITFSDFTALYSIANDGTAAVAVGELRLLGTVDAILVAADII